ncbi:hypothetical protein [Paraburkholderia sp. MM5384-R2]|uniref:hypothetical protein n=1 Tax=Paraburkholderia sp. MM5384-R2 TaxID=2723097 RepID=UPI00160CB23B|nr:hypothetical protein [Paraburkholderia sp. MM5384-R2]MBB5503705.1 hypothetical protein [Paraburkholderia sp. MM5384-R2]
MDLVADVEEVKGGSPGGGSVAITIAAFAQAAIVIATEPVRDTRPVTIHLHGSRIQITLSLQLQRRRSPASGVVLAVHFHSHLKVLTAADSGGAS